jgi:hypothetical protein
MAEGEKRNNVERSNLFKLNPKNLMFCCYLWLPGVKAVLIDAISESKKIMIIGSGLSILNALKLFNVIFKIIVF